MATLKIYQLVDNPQRIFAQLSKGESLWVEFENPLEKEGISIIHGKLPDLPLKLIKPSGLSTFQIKYIEAMRELSAIASRREYAVQDLY